MNHGPLIHIDLFSGIGGFALAADRAFGTVEHTFVEIDPFCQAVLKKHWPGSSIHGDIHTYEPKKGADILTGGFPCQPFSAAGKRGGTQDDRHLWPQMLRVIRVARPRFIVAENVNGLVTWNGGVVLETVLTDLAAAGYETLPPLVIPAAAVGAPHRRDRIWIVAHAIGDKLQERGAAREDVGAREASGLRKWDEVERPLVADSLRIRPNAPGTRRWQGGANGRRIQKGEDAMGDQKRRGLADIRRTFDWCEWPAAAREFCRMDDGIPRELDTNQRIKALGNSIVPQVAEQIMRAIVTTA